MKEAEICPATDNYASCETGTLIHILQAANMNAIEIHRESCTVYDQNVMSEGTVRQWSSMCRDGRANVHNEE